MSLRYNSIAMYTQCCLSVTMSNVILVCLFFLVSSHDSICRQKTVQVSTCCLCKLNISTYAFVLMVSCSTWYWRDAYRIACLGVTEEDWRLLALEALEASIIIHTQNTIMMQTRVLTLFMRVHVFAGFGAGSGQKSELIWLCIIPVYNCSSIHTTSVSLYAGVPAIEGLEVSWAHPQHRGMCNTHHSVHCSVAASLNLDTECSMQITVVTRCHLQIHRKEEKGERASMKCS